MSFKMGIYFFMLAKIMKIMIFLPKTIFFSLQKSFFLKTMQPNSIVLKLIFVFPN